MTKLGLIDNRSTRATEDVLEILQFVAARIDIEHGSVAVRILDGNGGGRAYDETKPKWAGRHRHATRLTILQDGDPDEWRYGSPLCCWYSTRARRIADEHGPAEIYRLLAEAWDRGERHFDRWPIYVVWDWREALVHLAAHEFTHLQAFDRDRIKNRGSEVHCEEQAARILDEWKLEHPNPKEVPMEDTIVLAKMGDGKTWHVITGIVTDDIAKTACGLRRVPVTVEAGIDGRAVRHRGADVCANCRIQLDKQQQGGTTTMSKPTITDTLTKEAGKAARGGQTASGAGKGGTATATRPKRGQLSARAAAEQILRAEGKPMPVKEITRRILDMPETNLGGKTPEGTIRKILDIDCKKPMGVFRRTKPGTYTIRRGR